MITILSYIGMILVLILALITCIIIFRLFFSFMGYCIAIGWYDYKRDNENKKP
jgi:uncharacterized protein involved in cysteine biosynthesis